MTIIIKFLPDSSLLFSSGYFRMSAKLLSRALVGVRSPSRIRRFSFAPPRGEESHWRDRHLREQMSARQSQANPIKNTIKNSVPSSVRATLKTRERGTRLIG